MVGVSSVSGNSGSGYLGSSHVRVEVTRKRRPASADQSLHSQASGESSLQKVRRLKEAISSLSARELTSTRRTSKASVYASVTSAAADFESQGATTLRSTEEVNTAPTSYTPVVPTYAGSTLTAPWATGSTATATVSGTYDGSSGSQTLTLKVTKAGTHGVDNLKLKVKGADGKTIEAITVRNEDPIDTVYTLSNGLEITFGAGDLIWKDTFTIDLSLASTSFSPSQPVWADSTAQSTIGGTYDGSNGTGALTFSVRKGGTHGVTKRLKIDVFAPDDTLLEVITIRKQHPIDKVYSLSNGLTFTLADGDLVHGDSFTVDVSAVASFATTAHAVASTASVTMGGIYDGAQGTGTLDLKIIQGGTHGTNDLAIEVYAPDETLMETVTILAANPLTQTYSLSNGLSFQVDAGTLVVGESFTVDVSDVIPGSVDPDNPFNDSGNSRSNFDEGLSVTAGSFDVNGVTITVNADDSLNSVLDRINGSAADVSAVFDTDTETVVLTRTTSGASLSVDVGNDTSGFLAATKLSSAVPVNVGYSSGDDIGDIPSLSAVSSGDLLINGVGIALDATTDSIDDVVSRINSSGAGVTAIFDSQSSRLSLSVTSMIDMQLNSNGTNFFEALSISTGAHESTAASSGTVRQAGPGRQQREQILSTIEELAESFNEVFADSKNEKLSSLRADVQRMVSRFLDKGTSQSETAFGLNFDFTGGSDAVFNFDQDHQDDFLSRLQNASGTRALRKLLFGRHDRMDGLAERLLMVVRSAERDLSIEFGSGAYQNPYRL